MTRPTTQRPPAESLRAWYDANHVDDVTLYDITAQTATSLSALLIRHQLDAVDDAERAHWAARVRLVDERRDALDPDDRVALIAQQQAWLDESYALEERRVPQPA